MEETSDRGAEEGTVKAFGPRGGVIFGCRELNGTLLGVCMVEKSEGIAVGGVTDKRSLFLGDDGKKGVVIGELDKEEAWERGVTNPEAWEDPDPRREELDEMQSPGGLRKHSHSCSYTSTRLCSHYKYSTVYTY